MKVIALAALLLLAGSSANLRAGEQQITYGKFGELAIYTPTGEPGGVAIIISGDEGWKLGVISMARNLSQQGAVVIGVDVRHYLQVLGTKSQHCHWLAADFEDLSHRLQKQLGLREYHLPAIIGYSSGATLAYAVLAQAPIGTFAGAITLGFCAEQNFRGAALCPGLGLRYSANSKGDYLLRPAAEIRDPWLLLQGQRDTVCDAAAAKSFAAGVPTARVLTLPTVGHGYSDERDWMAQFIADYAQLAARAQPAAAAAPAVSDLPLTLVPAAGAGPSTLTLLMTGDGGWAGIDQELSATLGARGIPVVGFNTLKYFWQKRTPEEASAAVARVLRHYLAEWHRDRIALIGYSFGADVLPFVINQLPADLRQRIASVSLLGLSEYATFEVKVADWLPGISAKGTPVLPELSRMKDLNVLCIYGEGEADTLCPQLAASGIHALRIGKGHHFSGNYTAIANAIIDQR